jgi:Mg/Co/Ni transporter MgtE
MPTDRIVDELFPPLILPEVRSLLAEADAAGIAEVLEALHPASLAAVAEELDDADLLRLMDHAAVEQQATVIAFLSPEKQQALAHDFGPERLARVLAAMSHDDRVYLLRKLESTLVEDLLPLVDKADREDIRRLLRYPADSAGAVMTTDYATLAPDLSVVATDEVRMREWFSVLCKELSVGLALGATMAVASFLLGMFRGGVEIGLVVGTSMLLIVVFTNLIGVLLPFALTKLKFDPAVASSPLITTVADATGLSLYFSVARLILPAFS